MSGKSITFSNKLLLLIFNATAIADIADNAASTPLTNFYASLHTDDPIAGDQTTHECTYTSYARVAIARTSSGFTVTNNVVVPVADIVFPTATGGSETAKFLVIGTDSTGAGMILYSNALDPVIAISSTITPKVRGTSSIQEN